MARLAAITFTGRSGTGYEFDVYPFHTEFTAVGAVYFVTRRTREAEGEYSHAPIYIGQTGNLPDRFDSHDKADCFRRERANCICTHLDDNEQRRLQIESDLLKNYKPPCND